jgi:hypothetical protein
MDMRQQNSDKYKIGRDGELKALNLFKRLGFEVQSPDWIAIKDNQCIVLEVKHKERFRPPPFEGHGLDLRQIYLRNVLYKKTGMRTYVIIFEINTNNIFGNYLDSLERGDYFYTTNRIRVYPLHCFNKL